MTGAERYDIRKIAAERQIRRPDGALQSAGKPGYVHRWANSDQRNIAGWKSKNLYLGRASVTMARRIPAQTKSRPAFFEAPRLACII